LLVSLRDGDGVADGIGYRGAGAGSSVVGSTHDFCIVVRSCGFDLDVVNMLCPQHILQRLARHRLQRGAESRQVASLESPFGWPRAIGRVKGPLIRLIGTLDVLLGVGHLTLLHIRGVCIRTGPQSAPRSTLP